MKPIDILNEMLADQSLFQHLAEYLDVKDIYACECLNRSTVAHFKKPRIWEAILNISNAPSLHMCFRRAGNAELREMDLPPPNVNRNGLPATIQLMIVNDKMTHETFCLELRSMFRENVALRDIPPIELKTGHAPLLKQSRAQDFFKYVKVRPAGSYASARVAASTVMVISGGLANDVATFLLWSVDRMERKSGLRGFISVPSAASFDVCDAALVVGCTDGTVKVWEFKDYGVGWDPLKQEQPEKIPCSKSLSTRTGLSIPPFLKSKSSLRIDQVSVSVYEGALRIAGSTTNGNITVWDASESPSIILALPPERIHATMLNRAKNSKNARVTSLLLFRSKLICGTSLGLIRVFDMRNGKLALRVGGHPKEVRSTTTNGGVMWSGGAEGSVRWWGGKTAKVIPKSSLCDGPVTALEINESVLVAAYGIQGMSAYDVRTQSRLCTFSNGAYGGIKSVQFDKTKLLTVSTKGEAALWRWHDCQKPQIVFPSEIPVLSAHFDNYSLVLGLADGSGQIYALQQYISAMAF